MSVDIYKDELLYGLTDEDAVVLDRLGSPVCILPIVDGKVAVCWRSFESRPETES